MCRAIVVKENTGKVSNKKIKLVMSTVATKKKV